MDTSYSSHNDNHFVGHHDFLSLTKQLDIEKEQHLPHPTANTLQWSLNLPDLIMVLVTPMWMEILTTPPIMLTMKLITKSTSQLHTNVDGNLNHPTIVVTMKLITNSTSQKTHPKFHNLQKSPNQLDYQSDKGSYIGREPPVHLPPPFDVQTTPIQKLNNIITSTMTNLPTNHLLP